MIVRASKQVGVDCRFIRLYYGYKQYLLLSEAWEEQKPISFEEYRKFRDDVDRPLN